MNDATFLSATFGLASGMYVICTLLENAKEDPRLILQVLYPLCAGLTALSSYLHSPCGPAQNRGNFCTFISESLEDDQLQLIPTSSIQARV